MFCIYRNAQLRSAPFGTVHFDNKEILENNPLYYSILNPHSYFI